jgi:hypothetical protein
MAAMNELLNSSKSPSPLHFHAYNRGNLLTHAAVVHEFNFTLPKSKELLSCGKVLKSDS